MADEAWAVGAAYEAYVGRWSRRVAEIFVARLAVPPGRSWLDVGCGTGALCAAVIAQADPARVAGIDRSAGFVADARAGLPDPRAGFAVGDACALPVADGRFGAVVSGLALNFTPDPAGAVAELVRVAAPGAVVAAYVWDYAGGMAMMRVFWDAAAELDPDAAARDEGRRFPFCAPEPLRVAWERAGAEGVSVEPIEIPTVFTGFDDFWTPFLGGQGPAPAYLATLAADRRDALRDLLRARLPEGAIALRARAWTVRGRRPATR
jgi:SAM-dependent methyltransferase